jgi:hypothetical protein
MTEVLLAELTVSEPLEGLEKMKAGTSSVKRGLTKRAKFLEKSNSEIAGG